MAYILFVVYLALFCWLMIRIPFVKRSGISSRVIILLFLVKIAAGIAIGWLSYHTYSVHNDYWDVNTHGWEEYQLLWRNPREYFTNIFTSGYAKGYGGLFDSFQSFWNDLKNNVIIKLLSVTNIFSRGNYYVNSLFFNFICFLGHVAFYRVFIQVYKKQERAVILCCFLLPSMLYFSSGIQKDGIVFTALGIFCYIVFQSLQEKRITIKRICILLPLLVLVFLIRSYVVINLLPACFIWVLVERFRWRPLPSFTAGYIVAACLFFNINFLVPAINPLKTVVQKQADFMTLPVAATQVHIDTLHPNFSSFMHNVPQAYNHLLLRPYLTELSVKTMLPINIETFVYQLLFIGFLFFRRKEGLGNTNPFIFFGVFFSLAMYLFIGYIMPNLGSLIRYRSIYLPFLITPLVCGINWLNIPVFKSIKK